MRSPSVFSDVSFKPSFLRTTPAKKPRTECCCQPVAFMIAAIVAPLGCLSRVRTVSCLVPLRLEPEAAFFPSFAGFFSRLVGATFVLLGVLRCDILRSFRLRRHQRRHHRSPALASQPAGRDLVRAISPQDAATVTLCWRQKASHFWIMLLLIFGRTDHG